MKTPIQELIKQLEDLRDKLHEEMYGKEEHEDG